MELKRKAYDKLLKWKKENNGKSSLLIEGARRIGKSTIAKKFGEENYKSYILIDFNNTNDLIRNNFENNLMDLDTFFSIIEAIYRTKLYKRDSLIIFDEIQKFPRAREALKYLVEDGRYDYIATGSLISIKENVKDITLPSEEDKLKMYPLDFEEFLWAAKEDIMINLIRNSYKNKKPFDITLHKAAMQLFIEYILVGGMPQSVVEYFDNSKSFISADRAKRKILAIYRDDIKKSSTIYGDKVNSIFENIPAFLSTHEKRILLNKIDSGTTYQKYQDPLFWLEDSMICNLCYKCNDPMVGFSLNKNESYVKCYMGDTGLLTSQILSDNSNSDNKLYEEILSGKLSLNKGMLFENVVAQMLTSKGISLYYYTSYNSEKKRNDIEIDFLLSNKSMSNYKVYPIEVKSGTKFTTTSYNKFKAKFEKRIAEGYVISPKPFEKLDFGYNIPPYMVFCLFE